MRRLPYLWKEHRVLSVAFFIAVIVTSLFLFRTIFGMIYWADPKHQDRDLEAWMTPRYISMSYQLPRGEVLAALGIAEGDLRRPMTLRKISDLTGAELSEMEISVEAAAERFREGLK